MTMYYYDNASAPSNSTSGHFAYNYTMQDHCGLDGIQGGPNWCMSENNANATYRAFNYPHHTASYYNMYRVLRYYPDVAAAAESKMSANTTLEPWSWYLHRAANTTVKFGAPTVGVMDGTVFREVLRSVKEEAEDDPATWSSVAGVIEANMQQRAAAFAGQHYPYGSEFAFDTTGQEEVVVWLLHFANSAGGAAGNYTAAAKRTVDHVLSYMRSSPTWAYHGGTRSWGDLGNNGKWMVSHSTASNFETRGNMHYRAGLNMIPLIEWFRANPDEYFLLEIAMGAQAGQLMSVDPDTGAPSMMLHMLPHINEYDPHSGDFGLGFFGHTLEAGAYFVHHETLGPVCFLCDIVESGNASSSTSSSFVTRDSYRQRVFLEPLSLLLEADTGIIESVRLDMAGKQVTVTFAPPPAGTSSLSFNLRRLRVTKTSKHRGDLTFTLTGPSDAKLRRGAYEFAAAEPDATISWP